MSRTQLYLISPPKLDLVAFAPALAQALEPGGVTSFQLRLKDADDETVALATKALLPICHRHHAAFILNDRPDLAHTLGADGVHLGQEDLNTWPVEEARKVMGEQAVIGVSCHASQHLAMESGEAGADYVAFGAFHPTTSKPMEKLLKWGTPNPEILTWWSTFTVLPCVAIGGITPANCAPLIAAGADFLAVITAVWNHPKGPGAAVNEFNQVLQRHTE